MGFLFGLLSPVEKVPPLVLGPAIAVLGLAGGFIELHSPGTFGLGWCVGDVIAGLCLTAFGLAERRRRSGEPDDNEVTGE